MARCPGGCGGEGTLLLRRVVPCVRCDNGARMRHAPPGLTSADLGVVAASWHRSDEYNPTLIPPDNVVVLWTAYESAAARDDRFEYFVDGGPVTSEPVLSAEDVVRFRGVAAWNGARVPVNGRTRQHRDAWPYIVALIRG